MLLVLWKELPVTQLLISQRTQNCSRLAMVVLQGLYEATSLLTLLEVILLLVFIGFLAIALITSVEA